MARRPDLKRKKDRVDTYGYEHKLIPKLINSFMFHGRKTQAEKLVMTAFTTATAALEINSHDLIESVLNKLRIIFYIKEEKRGRKYNSNDDKNLSESAANRKVLRLLRNFTRKLRVNKPSSAVLAGLLVDTHLNQGPLIKEKEDKLNRVDADKAWANLEAAPGSKKLVASATV